MKTNTPLIMAALASLALVGCRGGSGGSGGGGGDTIANVNGESISSEEFHKCLERKPVVQVVTDSGAVELPVAGSLGFQAMRDLINRRILLQVAKDDGVFPTPDEVTKELNFQLKRRPDFIKQLNAQGLNTEDIKRDLTVDLAKERIVTKGVTVTPADADKFIKDNPTQFENPPQAKLRLIAVRDDATKKLVDADLAAGKPFTTVAVQYSIDPNVRKTQGLFQITAISQMPPALQALVNKTPELKTTPWQQDGSQFVKIYVEQKIKAKPIPIDDTVREVVRRQLALQKGGQATDLAKRLVDKLKTSKVAVDPPALKTAWDAAFNSLKEQDVKANTGTGATAGAPAGGATVAPATAR